MPTLLQRFIHHGLSLVIPEVCPACGKDIADYPSPICVKCRRAMFSAPSCSPISMSGLDTVWSFRPYGGVLKDCVGKFKYSGARKMLSVFGELADSYILENSMGPEIADIIIPVPLHSAKLRQRGYNQAFLIAAMLSERLHARVLSRTLVKLRNTPPQMGLTRNERLNNLKGAFTLIDRREVLGKTVLLADDVMTTGATMETCAKELLRYGASSVKALTLARVL
jgi:competence protein ComFC